MNARELDTWYVYPKSGAMNGANLRIDLLKQKESQ